MDQTNTILRAFPAPRRVATAPVTLPSDHKDVRDSGSLVETLYYHPNAKIISFTATGRALSTSPNRISAGPLQEEEEPGTLSWSSQLERTIAVGAIRIYRAPGSVAFLNCGSALQPILPRSQCWCIDESNSKFVLQIRRPNYWRIELPVTDTHYTQMAEEFREVLGRILQFEKTKCPFKRSFTVTLPEPPKTPVIKRPWRPVRQSLPNAHEKQLTSPSPEASPASPVRRASQSPSRLEDEIYQQDYSLQHSPPILPPAQAIKPREAPSAAELIPVWEELSGKHRKPEGSSHVDLQLQKDHGEAPLTQASESPHGISSKQLSSMELTEELSTGSRTSDSSATNIDSVGKPSMIVSDTILVSDQTLHDGAKNDYNSGTFDTRTGEGQPTYALHEGAGSLRSQMKTRLRRTALFHSSPRLPSMTNLKLTTPPCASSEGSEEDGTMADGDAVSPTGSEESFHSVDSWRSFPKPVLPSPPASPPSTERGIANHVECVGYGANTIPIATIDHEDALSDGETDNSDASLATAPDGPTATVDETEDAIGEQRHPHTASIPTKTTSKTSQRSSRGRHHEGRRAPSPKPPTASVSSLVPGPSRSPLYSSGFETVKRIPMAIVVRTCGILLGPPSYLITLMLKVAAKITAGEWRGQVVGQADDGETIPVQWDYSDGDLSSWSDNETSYMDALQR